MLHHKPFSEKIAQNTYINHIIGEQILLEHLKHIIFYVQTDNDKADTQV